jgi:uncharacterized protein YjiS (DUF1127 family)
MTVQTATFFVAPAFRARFDDLRAQFADATAKRKVFRTTLAELQKLTTRDLADLGIAPGMIRTIAHEAAYGTE